MCSSEKSKCKEKSLNVKEKIKKLQLLQVEFILTYADHLHWPTNTLSGKWKG